MADKRVKTVSYHRVNYLVDEKHTIDFGMCVKQACFKVNTANKRVVQRSGGSVIRIAHYEQDTNGGYYIHLAVDTPGESASIVPKVADDAAEIVIGSYNPPNDAEFMDGDAFIYVVKNNVCMCMTGIHAAAIAFFFQRFFQSAAINKNASAFNFVDVANASKIALIHKRGVREIELRAALYSASFDYLQRKTEAISVLGGISRELKAFISKESDATNDSIQIQLTLKTNGRMKNNITIGKKRLSAIAEDILNNNIHDDDFVIITTDGQRITPSEIVLKKKMEFDTIGKSISRSEAYGVLKAYFNELSEGICSTRLNDRLAV